jgi:hypothetical protein
MCRRTFPVILDSFSSLMPALKAELMGIFTQIHRLSPSIERDVVLSADIEI